MPDSPAAARLRERLTDRSALVAIVGLGYVGLPIVRAFHDAGFAVLGYDTDPVKIDKLNRGEQYIRHLGDDLAAALRDSDRFEATHDPARLADADAILLCVPTPLGEHRDPDLGAVIRSTETCAATLRAGQLIVLESTTYPGTTREEMLPRLEAKGLTCGTDFFLAYSPEREDPGRTTETTTTIPKVVGGIDDTSRDLAALLYGQVIERVLPVSSAEAAEASKLLENIFRAVNIALVNELKVVFDAMGIDVWEVIAAASTKPFGFMPFYPGPGLGGHCIPIDPFYLAWKAQAHGVPTKFIELAGEVNARMPRRVVERAAEALDDDGVALGDSTVLVLGVAYKPNIDDIRETPAAEIIEQLAACGASVSYHDPHFPEFPPMRRYDIRLSSVPLDAESLAAYDAVIIVTDHAAVDYDLVGRHSKLVIDTRNAMAGVTGATARIVKA